MIDVSSNHGENPAEVWSTAVGVALDSKSTYANIGSACTINEDQAETQIR